MHVSAATPVALPPEIVQAEVVVEVRATGSLELALAGRRCNCELGKLACEGLTTDSRDLATAFQYDPHHTEFRLKRAGILAKLE